MMRQMRENTKWIMLVTALAFVALMVFEWGMDMSGRSAMGVGEIGRVNGTPVYYEDYILTYRNLYDQVQAQQEQPITSQQNGEIEDRAFDEVVNSILVRQELDRRGIVVTDEEVQQAAQFNPPPALAQNPAFLTDGQFDFQKYQQFLATQADEQFLLELEAYYRDLIPRGKLLRQLSSGLHLPDNLLWTRWRDQNETVEIRYIPLDPGQRIADDEVQVSEGEIEAYYQANQDDFEQPAQASIMAVVLPKTPTPADTAAVRDQAGELRARLQDGEDFADLALQFSRDEGSAQQGGELGVFTPGTMVAPFDSAVFNSPTGEILPPVESRFGVHVIEVTERWGQDSAQARHILLPFQRTDSSEIALLTRADSLENLGESMSLSDAADELGLEATPATISGAFAVVAGAGQVSEGADWAFEEASPGDVSPVFENAQAFYALELVESTPAGVLPLDQARETIRQVLLMEKKMALATERAAELVERIRAGEGLPNVAADAGLEVRGAGPFSRSDFVPGIGRYNAAIGTAFGLAPGEVSDVVEVSDNAFIIESAGRTPADSSAWLEQKDAQRTRIANLLEQQRIEEWLAGLRETARIVDRRDEVLQQTDEAEEAPRPGGALGF
jgi:parvulin-like peptidyl-prolyl isomerase